MADVSRSTEESEMVVGPTLAAIDAAADPWFPTTSAAMAEAASTPAASQVVGRRQNGELPLLAFSRRSSTFGAESSEVAMPLQR